MRLAESIVGDLKVAYEVPQGNVTSFLLRVTPEGATLTDGSTYDVATDTTIIRSIDPTFRVYQRRKRFGLSRLLGEWEKVVDIENGHGWVRGNLRYELTNIRY